MQKITEIKEVYTTRKRTNVNGTIVESTENRSRFRTVEFVDGAARFGHYLIDRICLYLFSWLFGLLLGVVLALTRQLSTFDPSEFYYYDVILYWVILRPGFYFLFEYSMQATPGKGLLKRVVIDEYGNKPSAKQIFIRTVSRMVPFESLSCLDTLGWHDKWSKTYVIRKKDLESLKLFQQINTLDLPVSPITQP